MAPKGAKRVQVNRSCSRENTTLLVAINAAGGYCVPLVICKAAQRVSHSWVKDMPDDWLVSRTESSVIDTALFLEWVKQFCSGLAPGQHLLFLDGHVSHISVERKRRRTALPSSSCRRIRRTTCSRWTCARSAS